MDIDSKKVLQNQIGLPTKEQMLAGVNTDNMPASIVSPLTGQRAPASLTEGEYIFDIPSIIGLGQGDYEVGLQKIQQIHAMLREKGMEYLGKTK